MKLPEDWYIANNEDSERLLKELKTEVISGHFLYRKNIKVIAHRDGATDDVLCKHLDEENIYTVVHLIWSMKPEIDVNHPSIEMHGTFNEFLKYESRM